MVTRIFFRDFEGLPYLQNYVSDCVEKTISKFDNRNNLRTEVVIGSCGPVGYKHSPHFECSVIVNGRGFAKSILVQGHSADFFEAVQGSMNRAAKELQRRRVKKSTTIQGATESTQSKTTLYNTVA